MLITIEPLCLAWYYNKIKANSMWHYYKFITAKAYWGYLVYATCTNIYRRSVKEKEIIKLNILGFQIKDHYSTEYKLHYMRRTSPGSNIYTWPLQPDVDWRCATDIDCKLKVEACFRGKYKFINN